ncbi:MAG TPA: helix-turn-helix domain-containing protein, partial [Thermoplasmata archaeon]|nr:helix-turn-helix domain-containing protein [Thermoplasmata archaeon]
GVALAVGGETVRYPLHLASFALFTRLGRRRALDHFVRGQIFGRIQERPGITYGELLRASGIGNGNLAYHLRVLEREGFVRAERQGRWKLLYPVTAPPAGRGIILSLPQRQVLDAVAASPGLSESALRERLGVNKRTLAYHLRGLVVLGLVREEGWGSAKRFLPGELDVMLDERDGASAKEKEVDRPDDVARG